MPIWPILRALRPHQWLKNILVFVPILAAHRFTAEAVQTSVLLFFSFSMAASAVYVINDIADIEADRQHPRKMHRPFAAGELSPQRGYVLILALLIPAATISLWLGSTSMMALGGYLLVTTAYSFQLKRRLLLDIFILAGLYTWRVIAGALATEIELSVWLFAFAIFFFFSLAAIKRQGEIVDYQSRNVTNAVAGRGYIVSDLPIISMMAIAAGYIAVLIMALYINSPAVLELYRQPHLLWGLCLILLFWISHLSMTTHRGAMNDDPLVFAITDRTSQFTLFLACGIVYLSATL